MFQAIHFVPCAESDAQENLTKFILSMQNVLPAYQAVKSWEENDWDLAGIVEIRCNGASRVAAVFIGYDDTGQVSDRSLSQPFLDFAKAYFLYTQALRPTRSFSRRLGALRCLELALLKATGSSSLVQATPAIFNAADNIAKARSKQWHAYHVGCELTKLANFLSSKRLVLAPFQWKSFIKRSLSSNRVGADADKARAQKLPSQAALDALPQCFALAEEPIDVLVSSVAALLCCSPDRIGEVLTLPADCEVEREHNGKKLYGLRWWPEKGGEPMVKWIAPTMAEVAKTAVAKLRAITQPARAIARWYENNPNKMFLPEGLESLRNRETINMDEVVALSGVDSRVMANRFLWCQKIPLLVRPEGKSTTCVKFDDFQNMVLKLLPDNFPILDPDTGMHYSDALVLVRKNELKPKIMTNRLMIESVSASKINKHLGSGVERGTPSLFSKFGFTELDGSAIKVTTHQFRHWLNTLAHRGGMSQLDIAKWSGRKDIRQNETYDHMTSHELLEMARTLTKDDPRLFGPLGELAMNLPVTRDEFMELEFPTAHTTEIGFCVHDFVMMPCQKHRDCISCNEHLCVKGDLKKTERIREQLQIAEEQLRRAKDAFSEGHYGSNRWVEHHEEITIRLRDLLRCLDNPSVPLGSLIRLINPNEHSPIRMAIQERIESGDSSLASVFNKSSRSLLVQREC